MSFDTNGADSCAVSLINLEDLGGLVVLGGMSVVRGGISADPDVFSVGGGLGGRLGNLGCSELVFWGGAGGAP